MLADPALGCTYVTGMCDECESGMEHHGRVQFHSHAPWVDGCSTEMGCKV